MHKASFIYIVQRGKHLKIGFSGVPTFRTSDMQTHSVEDVKLLHTFGPFPTQHARIIERASHYLLKSKKVRGEWFCVTDEEAAAAVKKAIKSFKTGKITEILQPKKYNYTRISMAIDDETGAHITALRQRFAAEGPKGYSLTAIIKRAVKKLAEENQ